MKQYPLWRWSTSADICVPSFSSHNWFPSDIPCDHFTGMAPNQIASFIFYSCAASPYSHQPWNELASSITKSQGRANSKLGKSLSSNREKYQFRTSMLVFIKTSTLARSSLQTMSSNMVAAPWCDGRVTLRGGGGSSSSSWIWNQDWRTKVIQNISIIWQKNGYRIVVLRKFFLLLLKCNNRKGAVRWIGC